MNDRPQLKFHAHKLGGSVAIIVPAKIADAWGFRQTIKPDNTKDKKKWIRVYPEIDGYLVQNGLLLQPAKPIPKEDVEEIILMAEQKPAHISVGGKEK